MLVNYYLILLYSYLCHYLDVLACMSSYLVISICTSQNYLFSAQYVINVHIFQLHQSSPLFSLWDIFISFTLGLCSLSNCSMELPFQWNKAHCLHCTPHPFPMIWKSQSSMELVRNIRTFLPYSFSIVFTGCILIFEYLYFLLQNTKDQSHSLELAINTYQNSGTQATVTDSLYDAIQQYGDNHDIFFKVTTGIILNNQMCELSPL